MAKVSTKEIIDSIKEMTILEVKDLVDAMKEEFGVDPSAVAVAAPAATATVEEGPSSVDIVLTSAGANKIAVIKKISIIEDILNTINILPKVKPDTNEYKINTIRAVVT